MDRRVRSGGIQTREGFRFELSGGDLALDFVNTIDIRPTEHPKELLPRYADWVSWSRQAGILSGRQEQALLRKSRRRAKEAEQIRMVAVGLRECLFRVFTAITDVQEVPRDSLSEWNRFVLRSMAHYELIQNKEVFSWCLRSEPLELDSMLWPVIHSAVILSTGPHASRIRRCASPSCDWLFLDASKRGNRRWCDMTVCGNRAKARRFYSRKKALRDSRKRRGHGA
jgi:predicted RNA-binding Zn ribbon-like protein